MSVQRYSIEELIGAPEVVPFLVTPPTPSKGNGGARIEGEKIKCGHRHPTLVKHAYDLRDRNWSGAAINASLWALYEHDMDHLPDESEEKIRGDIAKLIRSVLAGTEKRPDYWRPPVTAEPTKPDLVPIQPQVRVQDFPAEVMTGAAGDFAHLYSSYTEVPKEFLFMSYLTCLGLHLADSLIVDSELRQQPRLYTLLLGESADDRKSTAISKTVAFFKDSCFAFSACWGVGSGEGLQKKMGTSNKLLLAFDEFVQFVGKCRIDGSVLLTCVNSLFENTWYEGHTKTSSVVLENVYLSMLAASTTQTYEKVWDPKFIDLGFVNRVWLVTGKGTRKFSCPRSVPAESMMLAKKKLSEVLEVAAKHPVMEMTEEARERYDHWYMNRERTIYSKRLDTYALRFMPLIAVNDLKTVVDVETVEKVIGMCDHQHFLRQTYDPIDAENNTARLEEKIRRALRGKGPLGKRGLQKSIHAEREGLFFFTQALKNLMENNEVGISKDGEYFIGVEVSPKVSPPQNRGKVSDK